MKSIELSYNAEGQTPIVVVASGEPLDSGRGFASFDYGSVGPFQLGESEKLEPEGEGLLEKLKGRIEDDSKGRELLFLVIVGSTDIRPLSRDRAQTYESNTGLAAARAEWVRKQILEEYSKHRIIATVRGGYGNKYDDDRTVRVYGLWTDARTDSDVEADVERDREP